MDGAGEHEKPCKRHGDVVGAVGDVERQADDIEEDRKLELVGKIRIAVALAGGSTDGTRKSFALASPRLTAPTRRFETTI